MKIRENKASGGNMAATRRTQTEIYTERLERMNEKIAVVEKRLKQLKGERKILEKQLEDRKLKEELFLIERKNLPIE